MNKLSDVCEQIEGIKNSVRTHLLCDQFLENDRFYFVKLPAGISPSSICKDHQNLGKIKALQQLLTALNKTLKAIS